MVRQVESENPKIVVKPEVQHVSTVKSGRGKGFICYCDQVANVPNKLKIDNVSRKTRSQTITEEIVMGELANSINTYVENTDKSRNETDDADNSDIDLSDDNPHGDDDAAGYGVFMHNKSTATPNSTYLSLMVTSFSLDFIQTLLDETPVYELIDLMSHPVYTNAQTSSVVHNLKGNPELTSYISSAFEVPLGTHVDVLATRTLLQEMFLDENLHHIPSLPAKKIPYNATTPQPSSLQAKAKKLMQKAKKNMRTINFKKAIAQKFREYGQKMEALINFNFSEAFEKVVQAKVLTEMKKLLPTHISKAVANYVKPRLNTYVLELKLLNRIHKSKSNMTHPTNQKLYDTLYESVCLDHDALNAQDAKKSPMIHAQVDTPAIQPLDQEDEYIQTHLNPEWYTKSSSAGAAKRKRTWFDLLLKLDINQNENHILGPSTIAIANNIKAIIQKDELIIAYLEVLTEANWNSDEDEVMEEKYTTSITKHYASGYKQDLPRLSLNDVEDMYLFQVQYKLHHLLLELLKDFNNALLLFIRRVVIQNRVKDIQLGVESY
ncbi:hypothetical protein Tco_0007917 [Tanacetum coccineum]